MDFDFTDGPFSGMSTVDATDDFPDVLRYEDVRGWLWNSGESQLLLGVDGFGEPVTVDLASDSPHVMVSAGSGGGKSVTAASLATQALVKGSTVVFLDRKEISHRWAYNLPQAHYASQTHEMANALVSVAAEVRRRMRIIRDYPGKVDDAPVGPRIVIIAEELNALMGALADLEKSLPKESYGPLRAFEDIVNLGRAAKTHVVAFAQYPDYKVIPKRLMESFGYRVLIQHTYNSWNLLVARSVRANPPSPRQKGRGYVIAGDRAIQTQLLFLEEEECAQLVRDAYTARERMGLVPTVSRREERRMNREAKRTLRELEGRRR